MNLNLTLTERHTTKHPTVPTMKFTLTERHTTNTNIIGPDGQAIYHVETSPWKMFASRDTRVQRVTRDGSQTIGAIDWHSHGDAEMLVNGRRLFPQEGGMFSQSQTFRASDGVEYKWKIADTSNVLVVKGHSEFSVATFRRATVSLFSTNRPASLSVKPQAMHIMDDVVTTAVWFEEKRYRREKSRSGKRGVGGGGGGGC
ncbi:hypothetical protein FIBSPDRAFT_934802 [Athelia psychrophila]|uniref:DUF6593 domain-containing protein n=1 Tax=Athelia psychrophila TaxID=1759441 RepID=A0A166ESQ5_9AGAM|nr:hypothetical protein FIBSPDRAFT_934802 [Fibularhizoctonia sp. CBS 109695]